MNTEIRNGRGRRDETAGRENPLLDQHAALVSASGISTKVATARGYRSITTRAELARLGFAHNQQRVPALLIPIWNVAGELALYQIRPDEPRIVKGKALKYETPRGSRMVLDVPPPAREALGGPKVPLFITEGVRKADSAVSRGLCCIDVLGVWNWRGSNELGGKVALADWELVALNGRTVFIVFDSDVAQKPEVRAAMDRLKAFLERRGATVHIVKLPHGPKGEKVGLDDYLAGGHPIETLFGLSAPDTPSPESHDSTPDDDSPYTVERGRLCFIKETKDGPVVLPLCNFNASISEEVVIDDGTETTRAFLIDGRLSAGGSLPTARVIADRFGRMDWILQSWGVDAVISAGMSAKDRLREAIQVLSRDVKRRRIFAHTGWREIEGQWIFLSANGAVGVDGFEVELGGELSRYQLPSIPENEIEAVRISLDLLGTAPAVVSFPLLAGIYRAPLASVLPLDVALWIEGITGSLKSTLAALFLCHYGSFERTNPPENWSSTANALEKSAFTLKDMPLLVDDFAPAALDRRELQAKAARLLRAQGNLAGRGRLKSDLTTRPAYPPRGLIIGTGEARPSGRSILARTLVLDLDRKHINFDQLNASQAAADRLPHAMAGFVRWLAPQMPTLRSCLRDAFSKARQRALGIGSHLRIPEVLAHLWVGLDCVLSYATEIGACSSSRGDELRHQGWAALLERAKTQNLLIEEERPARLFLQVLASLITQKRVLLVPKNHRIEPDNPAYPAIGWFDSEHLYLIPEAAFQVVGRFAREGGEAFPVSEQTLRSDLVKEGVAVRERGRNTVVARAGGGMHRVLKLSRAAAAAILGGDFPLPLPVVTGVTGPEE